MNGTREEYLAAVAGYMSYSGRYAVEGDAVIHEISVSLFPNWIGKKQKRFFRCDGDLLVLRTSSLLTDGEMQQAELT